MENEINRSYLLDSYWEPRFANQIVIISYIRVNGVKEVELDLVYFNDNKDWSVQSFRSLNLVVKI